MDFWPTEKDAVWYLHAALSHYVTGSSSLPRRAWEQGYDIIQTAISQVRANVETIH